MSSEVIVVIVLAVFFVALILEVPIAWSLAGAGTLGIILLRGTGAAGSALAALPYQSSSSFVLTIVPMYILMGMFAKHGRIAEDVYAAAHKLLRRVPGSLGIATIAACAGFGAVSGSSVATVATIGKMSISEMRRYGYDARLATGIVGAAGTLAVLIPPSIVLVLYAALTGESVGFLLAAGIVPGALSAVLYSAFVSGRIMLNPKLTQVPPPPEMLAKKAEALERAGKGFAGLVKMAILFTVVIGGIYTGVVTATESAALGAVVAFGMLVLSHRREMRQLGSIIAEALREAVSITSTVFAIFFGAVLFTYFFVSAGVPSKLANALLGLDWSPHLIVAIILLATIPLGMFLDGLSILLIIVPLAYPVITAFGFSGAWFGILMVKTIEIGLVTPPVGVNAYMVAAAADGVRVETVFRGLAPFVVIDALTLAILFAFPAITTWLPSLVAL